GVSGSADQGSGPRAGGKLRPRANRARAECARPRMHYTPAAKPSHSVAGPGPLTHAPPVDGTNHPPELRTDPRLPAAPAARPGRVRRGLEGRGAGRDAQGD